MYFRNLVIISPWKRTWCFIWTIWIPFTQEWFVISLVKIGPVVLENKKKTWKVYDNEDDDDYDDDADNGQIVIRKAHFTHRLRWAKNKYYLIVNEINVVE